jgi:hypothetical protein
MGASTIKKYVDIVCDVLIDKDKLINKYISIPLDQRLKDIIACLKILHVYLTFVNYRWNSHSFGRPFKQESYICYW